MPVPTLALPTATASSVPSFRASPALPTVASLAAPGAPTGVTIVPLPVGTPIALDRNPRAVLLEADRWVDSPEWSWDRHVPIWRLYGDGLVVFAGPPTAAVGGLDASVRQGHLSDAQIFGLVAFLEQVGFDSLNDSYPAQGAPADGPTTRISLFVDRPKTVRVAGPDSDMPPAFAEAWSRITQTAPDDAQAFVPTEAYFEATDVGAAGTYSAKTAIGAWPVEGISLADAIEGITLGGQPFAQVSALIARQDPSLLFRDASRVYGIRFAPDLPRAYHPTDWIGAILAGPREFDGRTVEITGYFRGWNLYGEAEGSPPDSHGDWVIADQNGAVFVQGALPPGLDPSSRSEAWSVIRLTARVVYVRLGTSYLVERRVQVLQVSAAPATPTPAPTPTRTTTAPATETIAPAAATPTLTQTAAPSAAPREDTARGAGPSGRDSTEQGEPVPTGVLGAPRGALTPGVPRN